MYRKHPQGWVKHIDFMILDTIVGILSFIVSYSIWQRDWYILKSDLYRDVVIFLPFLNLGGMLFLDTHKNVLRRKYLKELQSALKLALFDSIALVLYLFFTQRGEMFSRMTLLLWLFVETYFLFLFRVLWKQILKKRWKTDIYQKNHLLLVTSSEVAATSLFRLLDNSFGEYQVTGFVLADKDRYPLRYISGIPVVCTLDEMADYMLDKWVDEVFFDLSDNTDIPVKLLDYCMEMGITTHIRIDPFTDRPYMHTFEKFAGSTVVTESRHIATTGQLAVKRAMDICGAVVGLLITGILTLAVGPFIYFSDPGPIFFSQPRIGKNGRVFRIYKFRSMYQNAEAQKSSLLSNNTMKGLMFKMENDPRIIGSGPDGTKHGIGWFIRRYSIDEFPQFWNVLLGQLSLVGTRPPLLDEWKQYERHHRARMSIRPGITGLWQVSGRNKIQDFEKVLALDIEYINTWTIAGDIKIIFKTLLRIFSGEGS